MTATATETADEVQAAFELLPDGHGERMCELAAVPERTAMSRALVLSLWERTGALDAVDGGRLCADLVDLSLLDEREARLSLRSDVHGVLRRCLTEADRARVAAAMAELVVDPDWLAARIRAEGALAAETDVALVDTPRARSVARALARSGHVLDWARRWETGEEHQAKFIPRPADVVDSELAIRLRGVLDGPGGAAPRLLPPVDSGEPVPRRTFHVPRSDYRAGHCHGDRLIGQGWGTVTVWDTRTGRIVFDRRQGAGMVAVAPDRSFAAFTSDGAIQVVDTGSGRLLGRVDVDGMVHSFAVAPDRSLSAYAVGYPRPEAWTVDTATGWVHAELPGRATILAIDDRRLLLLSGTRLTVHDPTDPDRFHTLTGLTADQFTVLLGPGNSWLAEPGTDGDVRIWDTGTGAAIATLPRKSSRYPRLRLSPRGDLLAVHEHEGVRIWDTGDWRPRHELTGRCETVQFGGDAWFAVSDRTTTTIHDLDTGRVLARVPAGNAFCGGETGDWLATLDELDGSLRIWDVLAEAAEPAPDLPAPAVPRPPPAEVECGWTVDHERDGYDTDIRLRDRATGELLDTGTFYGSVDRLVPGPGGAWLAYLGMHATQHGCTLGLWPVGPGFDGRLRFGGGVRIDGVTELAADPTGRWLAVNESATILSVWDTVGHDRVAVTKLDGRIDGLDWPADADGPLVWLEDRAAPLPVTFREP